MTTEEKAKAYDEAIERAKTKLTNEVASYIFPELKESEDERIRKQIKAFIKSRGSQITQSKTDSWIAWLEKQGEHANFRNKIQIGDKVTRNKDGVLVNLSQLNRVAKKQGEQKPVPKFKVGDTMRTLQEAADGIKDGLPVVVSIDEEYYHCNNELIAIKDQDNYEYPPINRKHNAWSEEDEKTIDEVTKYLKEYVAFVRGGNSKQYILDLIDRIESIKDLYAWKPSDEQMKALQESIGIVGELTLKGECLKELVEQLKAL